LFKITINHNLLTSVQVDLNSLNQSIKIQDI